MTDPPPRGQKTKAQNLQTRNDGLSAEVNNLKHEVEAIEERARNDLGMIKEGETFYQYRSKSSDKT